MSRFKDLYDFLNDRVEHVYFDKNAYENEVLWYSVNLCDFYDFYKYVSAVIADESYFDDGGVKDIHWMGDYVCVDIESIIKYTLDGEDADALLNRLKEKCD